MGIAEQAALKETENMSVLEDSLESNEISNELKRAIDWIIDKAYPPAKKEIRNLH